MASRNTRRQERQVELGQQPSERLREVTFTLLLLILVLVSGCELSSASSTTKVATSEQRVSLRQRAKAGQIYDSSARAAFAEGNYDRCESEFVASARLEIPSQRAQSLYGASRCAARRGSFQTSLFHLHAAASAGFGRYLMVVNDPLLRPLYGHARWQLVLGLIEKNSRKSDAVEASSSGRSIGERIPVALSFTTPPKSSI